MLIVSVSAAALLNWSLISLGNLLASLLILFVHLERGIGLYLKDNLTCSSFAIVSSTL